MATEKITPADDAAAPTDTDGAGNGEAGDTSADVTKQASPAEQLADQFQKFNDSVTQIADRQSGLEKRLEEMAEPRRPHGQPNGLTGGVSVRKGEDPLSSEPYSLCRLFKRLFMQRANEPSFAEVGKAEHDLSQRLKKAYQQCYGGFEAGVLVPLASDLMPTSPQEMADGTIIPGLPAELRKECRDIMASSMDGFDPSEYASIAKRHNVRIRKDLSANDAGLGGTFIALPSQGELIALLRPLELFSRVGATEIDLPPQGAIRFPKHTGSVSVAAYAESETITESTPTTGLLTLQANPYAGLVDIPEEMLKYSTSVAVEAWLRGEFTTELSQQADTDMLTGLGGIAIKGLLNYANILTRLASTVAAEGDTLEPQDPVLLYSEIADRDVNVDRGFFFAMTNLKWGGLRTARDSSSAFIFNTAADAQGNNSLDGQPVHTTSKIPTNRAKGSATDLTLLLGGVGADWIIARSGVVDIRVTESDASKFQQRISTMRAVQYLDAAPRYEESFGIIDDILNT